MPEPRRPRQQSRPLQAPLPELGDLLDRLVVVRIPLAVRFRGVTEREAALIQGPAGWGEFSPFLEYGPEEAAAWLAAACEAAYTGLPAPRRESVPVNATVPAVDPSRVEAVLLRYGERALAAGGAGLTVKVKVAERGQSVDDDVARVAEVRRLVPEAMIRVDANMGWGEPGRFSPAAGETPRPGGRPGAPAPGRPDGPIAGRPGGPAPEPVDRAVEALTRLSDFGLQYAEQPVASVDGLRRVRLVLAEREVPVPVAADESIRKAEDPLRVAREEAADLIVVKYAPLGGARRALAVIEESGLPAVVSSALDTSVGLSAGVALAAALPRLDYACGLGTLSLADDDVAVRPLRAGGERGLELRPGPVEVSEESVARLEAAPDRRQAWEERIRACHAVLAERAEREG
ncbi:enolase C-terminal domain-like protein [Arthrobacter sp. UM1]|uniref:enolase C-terminal domain-like protein n=1 Tax=Arthrobacter sp. UM1 TaxID=2766776 RepID=UPI001CF70726|nr:enolase C-terminal domain-like protein [Arthrobacter sp. UM1]MCB4208377.1 O-succinylbenzoate synthase [Arthrobacter sp. UM1]